MPPVRTGASGAERLPPLSVGSAVTLLIDATDDLTTAWLGPNAVCPPRTRLNLPRAVDELIKVDKRLRFLIKLLPAAVVGAGLIVWVAHLSRVYMANQAARQYARQQAQAQAQPRRQPGSPLEDPADISAENSLAMLDQWRQQRANRT